MIDPRTEAIQIAGRFRNGFRSLTHITSIKPSLEAMNASEVDEWLECPAGHDGDQGKSKRISGADTGRRIWRQPSILLIKQYVYQNGKDNYFRQDNFREQERVKSLYRSADSLFMPTGMSRF